MSTYYSDLPFTNFPDSVTEFVTMLNMTVADSQAVLGYQEAMQNGDFAMAQAYYNQITNNNQKFVDADKMNKLMNTCVALQRFYETDIEPYITTKQTEWNNRINQFNYKGVYSASTQYNVNNFVLYNNNGVELLYICVLQPFVGTPPTSSTYWRQLTIQGSQGASGTGVSFRFAWSSATNYAIQDVVTYGNSVWGSLQTPNQNHVPAEGSAYWRKIYSSEQVTYPMSATQPSGLSDGDLWFEVHSQ